MAKSVDKLTRTFDTLVRDLDNRALQMECEIEEENKAIAKLNEAITIKRDEFYRANKMSSNIRALLGEGVW